MFLYYGNGVLTCNNLANAFASFTNDHRFCHNNRRLLSLSSLNASRSRIAFNSLDSGSLIPLKKFAGGNGIGGGV